MQFTHLLALPPMPTIDELRKKISGLDQFSDYEIADVWAQAGGIPPALAYADLGIEQKNEPGFVTTLKRTAGDYVGSLGEIQGMVTDDYDNWLKRTGKNIAQRNPSGMPLMTQGLSSPWEAAKEAVTNIVNNPGTATVEGTANMVALLGVGGFLKAAGMLAGAAGSARAATLINNWFTQASAMGLSSTGGIGESQREQRGGALPTLSDKALNLVTSFGVGLIENLGGVQRAYGIGQLSKPLSAAKPIDLMRGTVSEMGRTPVRTALKQTGRVVGEEMLEEAIQNPMENLAGYTSPLKPENVYGTVMGVGQAGLGSWGLGGMHGARQGLQHSAVARTLREGGYLPPGETSRAPETLLRGLDTFEMAQAADVEATRRGLMRGAPTDLLMPTKQPPLDFGGTGAGTNVLGKQGVVDFGAGETLSPETMETLLRGLDPGETSRAPSPETMDRAAHYRAVIASPAFSPEQKAIAQEALIKSGFEQRRAMPETLVAETTPQGELFQRGTPRPALSPTGEGAQLSIAPQIEGNDVVTGGAVNPYLVGRRGAVQPGVGPGMAEDMFSGVSRPIIDRLLPRGVVSEFVTALGRGDLQAAERIGARAAQASGELDRFYQTFARLAPPTDATGQRALFHPNREAVLDELHNIVQRGAQALAQEQARPAETGLPVRQPPMAEAARKGLFAKAMGGKKNLKLLDRLELAGRVVFDAASRQLDKLRASKKATKPLIEQTQKQLADLERQYNEALAKKSFGKLIALQKQVELVNAKTGAPLEGMTAELPVAMPTKTEGQRSRSEKATELWRFGYLTDAELTTVAENLAKSAHFARADKIIEPAIEKRARDAADKAANLKRDLENIREEQFDARGNKAADWKTVDERVKLIEANREREFGMVDNLQRDLAMLINIARYKYDKRDEMLAMDVKLGMVDDLKTAEHAELEIYRLANSGVISKADMIFAQSASYRMDEGAGRDIAGFTKATDVAVKTFLASIPKGDERAGWMREAFGEQDPMQVLNKAALRLNEEKGGEFEGDFAADTELRMNKDSGKEERVVTRRAVEKLVRNIIGEMAVYRSRFGQMTEEERVAQIREMADRYGDDVMEVVSRYMETSPVTRYARVEFAHPDYWLSEATKTKYKIVAGLVLELDKLSNDPDRNDRRDLLKERLLEVYNDTVLRGADHAKLSFPDYVTTLLTNPPGAKLYHGTSPAGKQANTKAMLLRRDLLDMEKDKAVARRAANVAAFKIEQMKEEAQRAEAVKRPEGMPVETKTPAEPAKPEARSTEGETLIEGEAYKITGEVVADENGNPIITDLNGYHIAGEYNDPAISELSDKPAATVFKALDRMGAKGADVNKLKNQLDAFYEKKAAQKEAKGVGETVKFGPERTAELIKSTAKWIERVTAHWEPGERIWAYTLEAERRVVNWLRGNTSQHTLGRARLAAKALGLKPEGKIAENIIRQILLKLEHLAAGKRHQIETDIRADKQAKPLSQAKQEQRAADLAAVPERKRVYTRTGDLLRGEQRQVVPVAAPTGTGKPVGEVARADVAAAKAATPIGEGEAAAREPVRLARGERAALDWIEGDTSEYTLKEARAIAKGLGLTPVVGKGGSAVIAQIRARLMLLERSRRPDQRSRLARTNVRQREGLKKLMAKANEAAENMAEEKAPKKATKRGGPLSLFNSLISWLLGSDRWEGVTTIKQAVERAFADPNITTEERATLEHLVSLPDIAKLPIRPQGLLMALIKGGTYHYGGTGYDEGVSLSRFATVRVLIHEIVHAATNYGLDRHINPDTFAPKTELGKEFIAIWKAAKKGSPLYNSILSAMGGLHYGLSNPYEMLSEIRANPRFVKAMKAIPYGGQAKPGSLWQAFKSWMARLFNIPTKERSVFDAAMEVMDVLEKETPLARSHYRRRGRVGPAQVRNLGVDFMPRALQTAYAGPLARVSEIFNNTLRAFMPSRDVFESMQREGLKTVDQFWKAFDQRMAMHWRWENRGEDIAKDFHRIRYDDQVKISKLLADSTLKGWGYQPQWLVDADGNRTDVKINDEVKAQWDALSNADGSMSEAQQIVDRVFRFNDDMWTLKNHLINEAIHDKYNEERTTAGDNQEVLRDIAQREKAEVAKYGKNLPRMVDRPYAPLKRFGKYAVVGKSDEFVALEKEHEEATGKAKETLATQLREMKADPKHYEVRFEDNGWAVQTTITDLKKRFSNVYDMERTKLAESEYYELPYHVLSRLKAEIDDLDLKQSDINALQRAASTLYVEMLSQANARKNELERIGVAGYNEDMMQAFISQARSDASLVSTLTNNRAVLQAMRAMRKEVDQSPFDRRAKRSQLYNEVVQRYLNTTKYDDRTWQQKIMRGNSVMLLITSPAYLMQNASQVFMMTLPKLASTFGYGEAAAKILDTYQRLGFSTLASDSVDQQKIVAAFGADAGRAVAELQDRGKIDITIMQEIGKWATSGIMPKNAFTRWIKENSITAATGRGLSFVAGLPQRVEMMNRIVTGLAAYGMKKADLDARARPEELTPAQFSQQNHEKAIAYAAKMIDETQGAYDEAGAGRIFQTANIPGLPIKLLLQFRKFQIIQLSFMLRDLVRAYARTKPANLTDAEWQEEKTVATRAFMFALTHYGAMTGMLGLPFAGLVYGALAALGVGADDDEPLPSLFAATPLASAEDRQKTDLWLRKRLGGGPLATLLTRGIPTLAGLDLSTAIGAGTAASVFPYRREGKTTGEWVTNVTKSGLGATGGTLERLGRAADMMGSGDYYKGLEQAMPSGVGNAMQATREAIHGKTDKTGTVLTPADDISAWETALKGVGLRTTQEVERGLLQQKVLLTEQHYADKRKDIGEQYVRAQREGDREELADLRVQWLKMGGDMVKQGMKRPTLRDLHEYWTREQKEQRSVIGGVQTKKGTRRMALEGI